MSRLKNLEELNIQENEFSAGLPDVVGSIQSVKALDIGNCQLTTLPATYVSELSCNPNLYPILSLKIG